MTGARAAEVAGHLIEPEGAAYTFHGREASEDDMANPNQYPVSAFCDTCHKPVIMRHPGKRWLHRDEWLAEVAQ